MVKVEDRDRAWLFSKPVDLLALGLPVWAVWAVCFALPAAALDRELPLWAWAVFIVGIDVAHVWSTLFRTYLDREEFAQKRRLLVLTPGLAFLVFLGLAGYSSQLFWRVLAYVAVFHFIKQQWGFLALYRARFGHATGRKFFADKPVIYFSMLYPVLYWHLTSDRYFEWFVEGDFINLGAALEAAAGEAAAGALPLVLAAGNAIYWCVLGGWLVEEVWRHRRHGSLPLGKVLWMMTTAGNWYLGIVFFNSDVVFSITNVVLHGVPYLALVFCYVERKKVIKGEVPPGAPAARTVAHIASMLGIIGVLAFAEEYFWDMLLYRDNEAFFGALLAYPVGALQHPLGQAVALALLSVPQVTHYVIDGFIWKGKTNPYLKPVLFPSPPPTPTPGK